MKLPIPAQAVAVAVRVGIFAFFAILCMYLYAWLFLGLGYLTASALSVFGAALTANVVSLRIFVHARLSDVGLHLNSAAVRHTVLGLLAGAVAALFVTLGPVLEGAAALVPIQGASADWRNIAFLLTVLVLGGIGEELLFHGYAFQVLMAALGPFATILPVSVLFAIAHGGNLNVAPIALLNTGLWGLVLGTAFWRSGDLWLAIGLHVGWNWSLPLMGANLSGFTMSVMGRELRYNLSPLWSGGAYGPEGGLLTTAVLLPLFIWLIWKAPLQRQTPLLLRDQWEEM